METENIGRWWWAFTCGCPAGCLCHTQVTQSQETHYCCPNLAKNHQPKHSPWLIQVHQLRPSVMLPNMPTKDTFSDFVDHSHHWLHSFLLVTCFVLCHQIPLTKTWGEKKGQETWEKNMKMKRGKMKFLPWKFWFWRKIEAKKSEKCSKNWKKNKRAKKDIYRTFFYMAWCDGCPAAEMKDNWMHINFTRTTTARHAAMVKRAFIRACDPQRMWILK